MYHQMDYLLRAPRPLSDPPCRFGKCEWFRRSGLSSRKPIELPKSKRRRQSDRRRWIVEPVATVSCQHPIPMPTVFYMEQIYNEIIALEVRHERSRAKVPFYCPGWLFFFRLDIPCHCCWRWRRHWSGLDSIECSRFWPCAFASRANDIRPRHSTGSVFRFRNRLLIASRPPFWFF